MSLVSPLIQSNEPIVICHQVSQGFNVTHLSSFGFISSNFMPSILLLRKSACPFSSLLLWQFAVCFSPFVTPRPPKKKKRQLNIFCTTFICNLHSFANAFGSHKFILTERPVKMDTCDTLTKCPSSSLL